jgi:hypothetical protein
VRTAETVKAILSAAQSQPGDGASPSFAVLSNPKFLAEGTAIADLAQPDRELIGGEDPAAIEAVWRYLAVSHRKVGWAMGATMETRLVLEALNLSPIDYEQQFTNTLTLTPVKPRRVTTELG